MALNMQALHRHISQRLAHSCKASFGTEEVEVAAPFVIWSETSKGLSPSDSALCSLAKACCLSCVTEGWKCQLGHSSPVSWS